MLTPLVSEHLRIIAPAWPLQNTVAVNPFWNQIDRPFDEVMSKMSRLVHHVLIMPPSYYLEKYQAGGIENRDLEEAWSLLKTQTGAGKFDLQVLLDQSLKENPQYQKVESFTDFADRRFGTKWYATVTYEMAKYVSAYFDQGQALAKFPWRDFGFYQAWFEAQGHDDSFREAGIDDFHHLIRDFEGLSPEISLQKLALRFGFITEEALTRYLGRLSVLNLGWASQFAYHEWRERLGYSSKENARSIDLVAIHMVIDHTIAAYFEKIQPGIVKEWIKSLEAQILPDEGEDPSFNRVWQTALELAHQRRLAAKIDLNAKPEDLPQIQIAMCIDVRSETYRRSIEAAAAGLETIGFAGFFGLPFEYKKIDEKQAAVRAPVLLKPGFTVQEETIGRSPTRKLVSALTRSYFRNLRKAPMSSFLFVELFGLPALLDMGKRLVQSLGFADKGKLPRRFQDGSTRPSQTAIEMAGNHGMDLSVKVQTAVTVLTHMGLKDRFARLIVLAGHGSHNTNNAFASASDCGACGGHAGDVNARFLADLLNDPEVRAGLAQHSILIPASTRFLAALHETVTDELYLLDQSGVPESHQKDLHALIAATAKAGAAARAERQFARSGRLDTSPFRRTKNWSEVRPEWALAGNSSFIVAPRRFTKKANLEGRAFLHDYDWRKDIRFETLELIMTAPMLVTNWINMQYYASTVAPSIYGAGNKILHNLVNENGVLEGNGGDLRIGLPWQSVHDGERFVHEPLRLSVYIAAPRDEIEKVIRKHPTVQNLVVNEWLFIFHLDEESGRIRKRARNGEYL